MFESIIKATIELLSNKLFLSAFLGWVVVQIVKVVIDSTKKKDFTCLFRCFFNNGGMPSSHTSTVSALSTAVFLSQGFSDLFIVTFFLSIIVINDSFRVRYETTRHSRILNKKFNLKFNENIGHTFKQVVVGVLLGIFTAIVVFALF